MFHNYNPDPNDLMLPGGPAETAFYQHAAMISTVFLAVAFFFFFWFGWKGSENTPRTKYIAVGGMVFVSILAGIAIGGPGGIVTLIWMILASAGGYWYGRRMYHRDHPEGSPAPAAVAASEETKSSIHPAMLAVIGIGSILVGSLLAEAGTAGIIFAVAAGIIGWYFWTKNKSA